MPQPLVGVLTMSRQEWPAEGWFYNQAGETCGPASTEQLKELLAAARLREAECARFGSVLLTTTVISRN